MVAASVPQSTSLQKAVAASMNAAGSGAVSAVSATSPTEGLHVEDDVVRPTGRDAADEGPGQRIVGAAAVGLGLRVGGDEGVPQRAAAPG